MAEEFYVFSDRDIASLKMVIAAEKNRKNPPSIPYPFPVIDTTDFLFAVVICDDVLPARQGILLGKAHCCIFRTSQPLRGSDKVRYLEPVILPSGEPYRDWVYNIWDVDQGPGVYFRIFRSNWGPLVCDYPVESTATEPTTTTPNGPSIPNPCIGSCRNDWDYSIHQWLQTSFCSTTTTTTTTTTSSTTTTTTTPDASTDGACCIEGECNEITFGECNLYGGRWLGAITCDNNDCTIEEYRCDLCPTTTTTTTTPDPGTSSTTTTTTSSTTSTTTTHDCVCIPPSYCGSFIEECTFTPCVWSGDGTIPEEPQCGSTTPNPDCTSTTTTTSTANPCVGTTCCYYKFPDGNGGWMVGLVNDECNASDSCYCPSVSPDEVPECNSLEVDCVHPPPPGTTPDPGCGGSCVYYVQPPIACSEDADTPSITFLGHDCTVNLNVPCVCPEPSYDDIDEGCGFVVIPCIGGGNDPCTSTTTTTYEACNDECVWVASAVDPDEFVLAYNPCLDECPCGPPPHVPRDTCERVRIPCGTSPTSTTTTTSSTTSTTTTEPPPDSGACCHGFGECHNYTESYCDSIGGVWDESPCNSESCTPDGSCCYEDGTCVDDMSYGECRTDGGAWSTFNCASNICPTTTTTTTPAPTTTTTTSTTTTTTTAGETGACCYGEDDNLCLSDATFLECEAVSGVWWEGQSCHDAGCCGECVAGNPATCSEGCFFCVFSPPTGWRCI